VEWIETLRDLAGYRPGDFLMFSPRTYWRLFEQHNAAWWPWGLLWPVLALAAAVWLARGGLVAQRATALALAAASVFVAQVFVLGLYEPINWAARGLAWLWWVLAAALVLQPFALSLSKCRFERGLRQPQPEREVVRAWASTSSARTGSLILLAWALFGHPLLALLAGRPLAQAEVAGLAPDPTAIVVLAWLVQVPRPQQPLRVNRAGLALRAAAALAYGLAWGAAVTLCLAAAATLATMGEPQAAAMLVAPIAAVIARFHSRRPSPT